MDFIEMKKKTGVKVTGLVNQLSEYVAKDKRVFHSVDLLVNGHKSLLNIKLPEEFDRNKLIEGTLAEFRIVVSEYNGRTNLTACV